MTADRDDFTLETKRVLALRSAHRCSNPQCRNLTVRPHSDAARAVLSGVAAHIFAAAPEGCEGRTRAPHSQRERIER